MWPTSGPKPPTADEIRDLDEPFGTLMLELPLRDPGFLLPTWEELTACVAAARDRGARVHFDGARLWETTHHFGQTLDTIAALADSVYVSFYKTLGGLSGAMLVGETDFVASARAWRHRYGGNVYQQWPAALAALRGPRHRTVPTAVYAEHARVVADLLGRIPGARAYPAVPPHAPVPAVAAVFGGAASDGGGPTRGRGEGLVRLGNFTDHLPTGYVDCEITVASPALALSPRTSPPSSKALARPPP